MERELIELVKRHRFLYDKKDPDCKKRKEEKSRIWSDIGQKLKLSGEEAKDMWTKLSSRYRRARRRQQKNMKSGVAAERIKPWRFQKQMSFLEPFSATGSGYLQENVIDISDSDSSNSFELFIKSNVRNHNVVSEFDLENGGSSRLRPEKNTLKDNDRRRVEHPEEDTPKYNDRRRYFSPGEIDRRRDVRPEENTPKDNDRRRDVRPEENDRRYVHPGESTPRNNDRKDVCPEKNTPKDNDRKRDARPEENDRRKDVHSEGNTPRDNDRRDVRPEKNTPTDNNRRHVRPKENDRRNGHPEENTPKHSNRRDGHSERNTPRDHDRRDLSPEKNTPKDNDRRDVCPKENDGRHRHPEENTPEDNDRKNVRPEESTPKDDRRGDVYQPMILDSVDNTPPTVASGSIRKHTDLTQRELTNKKFKKHDNIYSLTKLSSPNENFESHEGDLVFDLANEGPSQLRTEENATNDNGRRDADQPIIANSVDNTSPAAAASRGIKRPTDLTHRNKKFKRHDKLSSLIKLSLNQQEESARERALDRKILLKQNSNLDDPHYNFFISMYQLTKRMPPNHQRAVRGKLFQAVSDAEVDIMNTTVDRSPSPSSSEDSVACIEDMNPASVATQLNEQLYAIAPN